MATLKKTARRFIKKYLFYSLFSFFLIFSLIWFIPESAKYLQRAVDYYQILKEDEISALTWLKENTNKSDIILCSGSTIGKLGWWVQGWAKRKSLSTEETYWRKDYTFKDEREEAENASRILSEGDHILENGLIRVADYSFQENIKNNPVIALKDVGKYQNLVFLNDATINLDFSTLASPEVTLSISPPDSNNKSISIDQTEDYGVINYLFEWNQVRIRRAITLGRSVKYVNISYEVNLLDATVKGFEIRIWPYLGSAEWQTFEISSVRLVQKIEGKPVCSLISTVVSNAECVDSGVGNTSEYYFKFDSGHSSFRIQIKVFFPDAIIREEGPVKYHNVQNLLRVHCIDYVFITRSHWKRCIWLTESGYFEIAFDSESVSIFKVTLKKELT